MTVDKAMDLAKQGWSCTIHDRDTALNVLTDEVERLRGLIIECLDENGHLADGDVCTLHALKMAVPEWEVRDDS